MQLSFCKLRGSWLKSPPPQILSQKLKVNWTLALTDHARQLNVQTLCKNNANYWLSEHAVDGHKNPQHRALSCLHSQRN